MPRSVLVALTDIIAAIDLAREASFDLSIDQFSADRIRRAATERALLTIYEAVRHLPDMIIDRNPEIQWQDIKDIGNLLRHEYWLIDAKIIWQVVQNDLDELEETVQKEFVAARANADDKMQ